MAIYRVTRTSQPNLAPASGSLVPGQLAIEMATQPNPRLWVGVPTTIDPTGRRLVVNSTGGGGGGGIPDAPTDGQIYGRDGATELWIPVLALTGGTMQGELVLNNTAINPLDAVPLEQVGTFLGFPVTATAPPSPAVGALWFNPAIGQLQVWNGTAWVSDVGGFLALSGGTMTGNLILDGPPSNASPANQAATRGYVDEFVMGATQFIGTIDASTGIVTYTTSSGIVGTVLVDPATVKDSYVICTVSGTLPIGYPFIGQASLNVGDWVISDGTQWSVVLVSGHEVLAQNVAVAPPVLGADNVQSALTALLGNFGLYAPLTSPGLEGIPTTPTPPVGDYSLTIANTAWVSTAIAIALQGAAGDISSLLFIGNILGSDSAPSGDFFDQITLHGDTAGGSPSTAPAFIDSIDMTGDASGLP
jgi:hypothetical protein